MNVKAENLLQICDCGPAFSFASPKENAGKRKRARGDFDFPPDLLEPTRKTASVFLDLSRGDWQICAPSKAFPSGEGGPKGRMRVGEHERYCKADIRCILSLISLGCAEPASPRGSLFGVDANTYNPVSLIAVSIDCTHSKAIYSKFDTILTGGAYHSARKVTACE